MDIDLVFALYNGADLKNPLTHGASRVSGVALVRQRYALFYLNL